MQFFRNLKASWRAFKAGSPGERFKQHYKRRQEEGRSTLHRAVLIGVGILIIVGAVFLLPIPGPSIPMFVIGGALIAQESRWAAHILDWTERYLRKWMNWLKSMWQRLSPAFRTGLVTLGIGIAGWGIYMIWFAG